MSTPLNIQVLLFASAAEQAGCSELTMCLKPGTRIADLRKNLVQEHPGLADGLRNCRLARNEVFAAEDEQVEAGDVVAVIPPVAGG